MTEAAAALPEERSPSVEFAVEPFSRCAADVLAFRNVNRPIAREQRYFEWRYRRPCAHEPLIVWARDRGGQPIGAASVIPHDYFVLDQIRPVGLLGDISVLPSHRGQGIAGRMLGFLARHEALRSMRACVVLPNDDVAGALRRAGWRDATTIHRFVKLLDVRPLLERRLGATAPTRWLAAAVNGALRALAPAPRYEVRETTAFDDRYDALWEAVAVPGRVLAVRNRAYLTWRFAQHPLGSCRVVEIADAGRLKGYAVFHRQGDLAVVDDYLADSPDALVPLFAALFERVREAGGSTRLQVRTNRDARLALPWRRLGFLRRKDTQRVMVLDPHAAAGPLVAAGYEWHVTAGDKDV